jgi:hypothetical protein
VRRDRAGEVIKDISHLGVYESIGGRLLSVNTGRKKENDNQGPEQHLGLDASKEVSAL